MGEVSPHLGRVTSRFQSQLANFLRKRRGEQTLAQFANRLGLSDSSLQRLELAQQNVTLKTLELIAKRLKCKLGDIFPDEFPSKQGPS